MPMERSHIWLGVFPCEDALNRYFEETYHEDRDDLPISRFAQDQGETWYDHDWIERGFMNRGDLRRLIEGHSYSADYIDKVLQVAKERGITTANTFIMADGAEFSHPKSIETDEYTIWYLGQYDCNI